MNKLHPTAILLGTLLSFCAHAQQPADVRDDDHGAHSDPAASEHSEDKAGRTGSEDDEAPRTLDGDQVLEGQQGDSTDHANPGGPQGDGRTDPGMLE